MKLNRYKLDYKITINESTTVMVVIQIGGEQRIRRNFYEFLR